MEVTNNSELFRGIPVARRLRYILEYVPLLFLVWILSLLPYNLSLSFGKALGRIVSASIRSRYQIAWKNITESFPELPEEKVRAIIKSCWENLGMGLSEFSKIPNLSKEKFNSLVRVDGLNHIVDSHKTGRGALIFTAHYGAWEIAAQLLPFSGFQTAVIARRVKNPYVNELVNRIRGTNGIKVILAKNALRESLRWLKQGNILVVLIDHRITEGNLQIPFFGKPANTTALPAILALRYLVPVHSAVGFRENEKIHIQFSPALEFSDLKQTERERGIYEATLRMNAVIEDWIRKSPEMWLWIHNRWKI